MTYHVKFTNAYKKGYKRAKKRGLNLQLIDDVVDELRQGHKLGAKYRDHALHGNWEGFRECHIQPDWLLIYLGRVEKLHQHTTAAIFPPACVSETLT